MVQQGGQGALAEASAGLRGIAVALDQDRQRHPPAGRAGRRPGSPSCCCPSCRPGSSIMPGKVNPVLCESVNQVAARVFGNDATVGVRRVAGDPRAQHLPAGDGRRPVRVGHAAGQRVPRVRRALRRRHRGRRGALPVLRRALVGDRHRAEPDHRLRAGRRDRPPGARRAALDHRRRRSRRACSTRTRPGGPRPAAAHRPPPIRVPAASECRMRVRPARALGSATSRQLGSGRRRPAIAAWRASRRLLAPKRNVAGRRPAGAHDRVGEVEVGRGRRRACGCRRRP